MLTLLDDEVFLSDFCEIAIFRQKNIIKSIRVIFDLEYLALDLGAEGRNLTVLCLTTDVLGARHGNTLTIRLVDYTVVSVQPDGDGVYTKLILSEGTGTIPDPGLASMIKTPFNYGDATPKPIYLVGANTTIFSAQIIIKIPFNGTGASLQLGDTAIHDSLIKTNQVSPYETGEYETNPSYLYTFSTQILLTINQGVGTTQGAGFVLLEF